MRIHIYITSLFAEAACEGERVALPLRVAVSSRPLQLCSLKQPPLSSPPSVLSPLLPSLCPQTNSQEVVDFVRERLNRPSPRPSNSDIMSELLDVCLHTTAGPGSSVRIGTDNMSAILVIIKQPPTGEGSRSREAEDGEGNLYNTTTTASKDKEQEGGSSKRGASEFSSESTRVDDDRSGAKKTKP